MILVAIFLMMLIALLGAILGQSSKALWKEAGHLVHGKPVEAKVVSSDLEADAIEALKELGMTDSKTPMFVRRAIQLCPDGDLDAIVNMVVRMRIIDAKQ